MDDAPRTITDRRNRIFLWLAPLLALSWLTIAFLDPEPGRGAAERIGLGYFLGSIFAHTTVSAFWAAFGPGRLIWRVPLSIVWICLIAVAIAINVALHGGPDEIAVFLGICLLGQWTALQPAFWALKLVFRFRLRHAADGAAPSDQELQFTIRQLLVITTVLAIAFAIGRVVIGTSVAARQAQPTVFLFLAASAVVSTLPLIVAALLKRWAALTVCMVLALAAAATFGDAPLMRLVAGGPRPNVWDLLAIKVAMSAVVLVLAGVVRLSGYRLIRSSSGRGDFISRIGPTALP